jgi:hypothetical protein
MADHIPQHGFLDSLQLFFECYLLLSLALVDLCRKVGITPTDHFYLQTRHEHKNFDIWVGTLMEECYVHCRNTKEPPYHSRTNIGMILGFLKTQKSRIEKEISQYLGRIGYDKKTQLQQQNTETREPTAIICVDEARGLLDHHELENSPFRSFRRAIGSVGEALGQGETGIIREDTTSGCS